MVQEPEKDDLQKNRVPQQLLLFFLSAAAIYHKKRWRSDED